MSSSDLTAETRLDRHEQDDVALLQIGAGFEASGPWVEHNAAFAALRLYIVQCVSHVIVWLDVNGDLIGTGIEEGVDVLMRIFEHEVDIEKHLRVWTHGLNSLRSKTEVWDKVAIHDIKMDPFETLRLNFRSETRTKIGVVASED